MKCKLLPCIVILTVVMIAPRHARGSQEATREHAAREVTRPPTQVPTVSAQNAYTGTEPGLEIHDVVTDHRSEMPNALVLPSGKRLPVVAQPENQPAYVSEAFDTLTFFSQSIRDNVIGLLAHNELIDEEFLGLAPGSEVTLEWWDGSRVRYRIREEQLYQALEPLAPKTDFVNLVDGEKLTAGALYYRVYTGEHHLTLQTCIEREGESKWGRRFLIGEPVLD